MISVSSCITEYDFSIALSITKDYIRWLDMDLSFQDIDAELSNFSSVYGYPDGLFLLLRYNGNTAGGVGFKKFTDNICEMKRLFVYRWFRGMSFGEKLCIELIKNAKKIGYKKMRLDTLSYMQSAIRLYSKLGFKEIAPYRFNPYPEVKYMELNL